MSQLRFEWDPEKARANLEKHGISFNEAGTVFADPFARIIADEIHSTMQEERFIILGQSQWSRLLVVVFVERTENLIRINSARKATQHETQRYKEENGF
jgi:uncharacterized DUF497 family protein